MKIAIYKIFYEIHSDYNGDQISQIDRVIASFFETRCIGGRRLSDVTDIVLSTCAQTSRISSGNFEPPVVLA